MSCRTGSRLACDMFLMPSLYEPCGLNQMYSLRYGTVPIVRHTGGLADSVENYDPITGAGTGIVFNDFDSEALEWALNMALDLHAQPQDWQRMVRTEWRRTSRGRRRERSTSRFIGSCADDSRRATAALQRHVCRLRHCARARVGVYSRQVKGKPFAGLLRLAHTGLGAGKRRAKPPV